MAILSTKEIVLQHFHLELQFHIEVDILYNQLVLDDISNKRKIFIQTGNSTLKPVTGL